MNHASQIQINHIDSIGNHSTSIHFTYFIDEQFFDYMERFSGNEVNLVTCEMSTHY